MSSAADERTGIIIITDLYNLTNSMVRQSSDPEFLMESVDKRQELMDEYDAYRALHPGEDIAAIKQMVKEILNMDQKLGSVLNMHRDAAKEKLTETQKQRSAMSYAASNISASGSYMNYKK